MFLVVITILTWTTQKLVTSSCLPLPSRCCNRMDASQEPLTKDNDSHLYYQLNLQDLSLHYLDPADRFGSVG